MEKTPLHPLFFCENIVNIFSVTKNKSTESAFSKKVHTNAYHKKNFNSYGEARSKILIILNSSFSVQLYTDKCTDTNETKLHGVSYFNVSCSSTLKNNSYLLKKTLNICLINVEFHKTLQILIFWKMMQLRNFADFFTTEKGTNKRLVQIN